MNKKQIKEFLERLEGPEGCDFKEETEKGVTWKCKGGNDQTYARKILNNMKIDKTEIETFLKKCSKLGGHCDCEILFNVADRL